MNHPRTIVLFGDSLLMDTVEAGLSDNQELGMIRMRTTIPHVEESLKSLYPDLIIFDWDAVHLKFILPFLRDQSGIPLIGLDIACSKAIVLHTQKYTVLTTQELSELIHQQTAYPAIQTETKPASFNPSEKKFLMLSKSASLRYH